MQIQLRGNHLGITPSLHEYTEKKIGRLERFFDAPPEKEVYVTLSIEHDVHRVEVMLQVHGVLFRAEEQSEDMYTSIDLVADKIEHQIHRYKTKLNQKFRDRGVRTRIGASRLHQSLQTVVDETSDDSVDAEVVRIKRFPMKPMDVEEAIMQMNLLGHDFFVFRNAESNEVNVVYHRRSGNYGLIEPGL